MERAVPAIMRMAPSTSAAFRSGILVSAICRSWSRVTLPTFSFLLEAEPLSRPAAFFSRIAAGGGLGMKVNERSAYTVISTGMIIPGWPCVRALNCLQNSMMFTPCWPSAGPTGGAGLAAPAGIWSFTSAVTVFFAIVLPRLLERLPLQEVQLHRRPPPEDGHHHLDLAALLVHLVDRAGEVG